MFKGIVVAVFGFVKYVSILVLELDLYCGVLSLSGSKLFGVLLKLSWLGNNILLLSFWLVVFSFKFWCCVVLGKINSLR